jgi:hypothetical protein
MPGLRARHHRAPAAPTFARERRVRRRRRARAEHARSQPRETTTRGERLRLGIVVGIRIIGVHPLRAHGTKPGCADV